MEKIIENIKTQREQLKAKYYEFKKLQEKEYDLTDEEPRWCKNVTGHVHSKDGYTLIYNSTIGGAFMLYREATDSEKAMFNDR